MWWMVHVQDALVTKHTKPSQRLHRWDEAVRAGVVGEVDRPAGSRRAATPGDNIRYIFNHEERNFFFAGKHEERT